MKGHLSQFQKNPIYTKGVSTPSTISQILIYITSVSWFWFYIESKYFLQFQKKIGFILNVSFKEAHFTIPQNLIYIKGISSKDTYIKSNIRNTCSIN